MLRLSQIYGYLKELSGRVIRQLSRLSGRVTVISKSKRRTISDVTVISDLRLSQGVIRHISGRVIRQLSSLSGRVTVISELRLSQGVNAELSLMTPALSCVCIEV